MLEVLTIYLLWQQRMCAVSCENSAIIPETEESFFDELWLGFLAPLWAEIKPLVPTVFLPQVAMLVI